MRLATTPEEVPAKTSSLMDELSEAHKQIAQLRRELVAHEFDRSLQDIPKVAGIPVLTIRLPDADADTLREMSDRFRQLYASGVAVLASVGADGRPLLVAAVTEDLVQRGLQAGDLVKHVARPLGGGGGGRPTLAQAGGKDATHLDEALASVPAWVEENLR